MAYKKNIAGRDKIKHLLRKAELKEVSVQSWLTMQTSHRPTVSQAVQWRQQKTVAFSSHEQRMNNDREASILPTETKKTDSVVGSDRCGQCDAFDDNISHCTLSLPSKRVTRV